MQNLSTDFLRRVGNKTLYPALNSCSAFMHGSGFTTKRYFEKWYEGTVRMDYLFLGKRGFSQSWIPETDLAVASAYVMKEYEERPEKFEARMTFFHAQMDKVDRLYSAYTYQKIETTPWNECLSLVNEVRDAVWDANAAVIFCILFDLDLCKRNLKSMRYPLTSEALEALWPKAIVPAFDSFDVVQREHFLHLFQEQRPFHEIVEACQYITVDYYSIKNFSSVEALLRSRFDSFIHDPASIPGVLRAGKEKLDRTIGEHTTWLATLSAEERAVAEYIQLVMNTRDRRKNFFGKALVLLYRVAEKMFKEVGVSEELIPYYTVMELLHGPEYLRQNRERLTKRIDGFQLFIPYADPEMIIESPIDDAVCAVNDFFLASQRVKTNVSELKGQPGSKGIVRGTVHVVLDVNSHHGFKDGEILVTGMTRPEYVPLMKKAAGVVTDEGGITCHAAIVAREMHKPCVIGTKVATKVLKDGDRVEVDVVKGTVHIVT